MSLARLTLVPGKPIIYIYDSQVDIVSRKIRQLGEWQHTEVKAVVWALNQTLPGGVVSPVLFVDIGANIGSLTLAVAAHGHTVVAFEGMPNNVLAMQASLCANPTVMPRVHLVS
ncbi:hypothetical protein FOA52_010314 [Chlamydomonas sp. UWO 241]|nr:hypothetical protein FOA52_010314 [Chlamydomonas sp. UWO 241]